jgi:MoaA/NifB/PqqE/SkfB family radical SAM enzyme
VAQSAASSLTKRARAFISAYGLRAFTREVWTRGARRLGGSDAPSRFHVEISNTCNFDCEYCVLREQSTGDKVMSEKTFSAVLPHLKGASSVALSGLAEPLMNRHFTDYLRRVRQVAPHALITIDTNASLLTEEIARAMVEQRLGSLVFSLDGADAELVDGIRQGGSLDGIVGKVRMLNAIKAETGSRLPALAATMVLQRKNVGQLAAVVELADSLGVDILTVNGLEPYSADLSEEAVWVHPETVADELGESAARARDRAAALGVELRFPALVPQTARCPQMGRPVILADGTVVPCSVLAYHRDGYLHIEADGSVAEQPTATERLVFGNVNERPLTEIWSDSAYRAFRARVASGDFPESCDACLMKHNVICPNEPLSAEEFASAACTADGKG